MDGATPAVTRLGSHRQLDILLVDLNNFASFPTLAIGILIATLRDVGHNVELMVPLAYDIPGQTREKPDGRWDHLKRKLHHATHPALRVTRDVARSAYYRWRDRVHPAIMAETVKALDRKPDVVLLSTYLMHYRSVVEICADAKRRGIPVIVGGPALNLPAVAEDWRKIDGLTAVYGGEADLVIADLVRAAAAGEDLAQFPGVVVPDGRGSPTVAPFRPLDASPVPDFGDFPWDRYPIRVIPMMTGRGCQWNKCVFCSDVVIASGRSFRTRTLENVLAEIREQSRRYQTNNFIFLDLKLNSVPDMFRGLAANIQTAAPGAQWIGTVHVDQRTDNGLSLADLKAASRSGMRRINYGLESGSQRLLDLMKKGATVEANSAFARHAHEAGLSVRCSMFRGFPGETPDDVERTTRFLEEHMRYIDRINFCDFSVPEETPVWHSLRAGGEDYPGIKVLRRDATKARVDYINLDARSPAYRKAKARLLEVVYAINRRPLRPEAQMFDRLM